MNRLLNQARLAVLLMIPGTLCASLPSSDAQEVLPITVEEWSIWVGSPAHERINDRNAAGNAMPSLVGTARPKQDGKSPFGLSIAPVSVVRFLGEPTEDIDVEVRLTSGSFLSHWPLARERVDSLRWFGAHLSRTPPENLPLAFVSELHPFRALRELDDSLVIQVESRAERFLSYDAELAMPIPLTLENGPNEYTLQNISAHSLYDLAVVVPVEGGYRIGWLDELPAEEPGTQDSEQDSDSSGGASIKEEQDQDPTLDVFDDNPQDNDEDEEASEPRDSPPAPLPAEADARVRSQAEQRLNQAIVLDGSEMPIADVLRRIGTQIGLQMARDEQTLAEAGIDLDARSATPAAGQRPARDVLAEVLGNAGMSYRITEYGTLFLSTSERLNADSDAREAQLKGPPATITLSEVYPESDTGYANVSDRELLRRLVRQGIGKDRARSTLDALGADLFRPDQLIVVAHLARDSIDELVPLDVFPPADRTVRVATVIISGIDPNLSDQALQLVAELGNPSAIVRETAERNLLNLGPVAIPTLRDALTHQDLEVVYRVERLLRLLNQPIP